jgi:O-antigen ligase
VTGFTSQGRIIYILYDLPKFIFLYPAALLIAFFFVFSLSYHQERRQQAKSFLRKNTGLKLILLLFGFQALSLTSSLVRQNGLLQLFIYFAFIQLFIALAILFQQHRLLHASLLGTCLSLIIFCPLGILQFFDIQLPFLLPIKGPASTMGYRNPAAHYLVLNLPLAAYLGYHYWQQWYTQKGEEQKCQFRHLSKSLLFAAIFLMALIHIFMTTTRTAILALIVYAILFPAYYLFSNRRSLSIKTWGVTIATTMVIAILIIGSLAVFPKTQARVMRSVNRVGSASILEARQYHWGNTLYMIKEHPWRGVGLGNWQFAYPLYMKSYQKDSCFNFDVQVTRSHNDYLQLAAECGVGAFVIFLLLWGRQFFRVWKIGRHHDAGNLQYPLFCSLLAFSVIMMFSFPLQMGYSRMFFFYLLALGESL